ncbi:MAG: hypothetical protein NWE85_06240 [Candidatus Bathyarchaeota archaeon]|nr:hypothetical protein [Candidatus Bathyarchaeota archaeon]
MKRTRLEEVTRLLVNTALGMEKADLVFRDGGQCLSRGWWRISGFSRWKNNFVGGATDSWVMSGEMPVVCRKIEKLQQAWKKLGCTMESPFMDFSLLALPVLPELRATDKGLANVKNFKFIPLFV